MLHLSIQPHFESDRRFELEVVVLPKLSSYKPPIMQNRHTFKHLKGLTLAHPHCCEHSNIDELLGADVCSQIIESQIIKGLSHELIALSSKLGWLLTGSVSAVSEGVPTKPIIMHCSADCCHKLLKLLQDFWRAEEMAKKSYTLEEQACEDHFSSTFRRDDSVRCIEVAI